MSTPLYLRIIRLNISQKYRLRWLLIQCNYTVELTLGETVTSPQILLQVNKRPLQGGCNNGALHTNYRHLNHEKCTSRPYRHSITLRTAPQWSERRKVRTKPTSRNDWSFALDWRDAWCTLVGTCIFPQIHEAKLTACGERLEVENVSQIPADIIPTHISIYTSGALIDHSSYQATKKKKNDWVPWIPSGAILWGHFSVEYALFEWPWTCWEFPVAWLPWWFFLWHASNQSRITTQGTHPYVKSPKTKCQGPNIPHPYPNKLEQQSQS